MIRLTVKQWCVLVAVLCGTYLFGMVFRCFSAMRCSAMTKVTTNQEKVSR